MNTLTQYAFPALLAVTLATSTLMLPVQAKPAHANKGKNHAHTQNIDHDHDRDYRYSDYSRSLNRGVLSQVLADALTGQRRYDIDPYRLRSARQLPPGIAKKLRRGQPLPPGIAKNYYPLPYSSYDAFGLDRRYRAGIYGDNLIIASATGIVLDVLRDIF